MTKHSETDADVSLQCAERQFAFDVCDVRVLKFGRTDSNSWAYLRPNTRY